MDYPWLGPLGQHSICSLLVIPMKRVFIVFHLDGLGTSYVLSKGEAALRSEGSGKRLGDSHHVFGLLGERLESSRESACGSPSGVI